jgi:hypothetical protein
MTVVRALLLAVLLVPTAASAASGASSRGSSKPARESAERSFGLRLGAVTALSSAASGTKTAPGGGAYFLFDMPGLLLDVSADVFAGEGARLVGAGFGAYFPMIDDETTPYLGGGMKLGWSRFGGDGAFGLLPFGAVGLLIGRSWTPQVRIELAYFVATATERRGPGFASRHANGPIMTFGIAF